MSDLRALRDKQFNGYLKRRIPHALDDVVDSAVAAYRSASGAVRKAMLGALDPGVAAVLSVYGERMAAVAVRSRSAAPLRRGLVAMGMAEGALADSRENLIVLAAVNHSADTIGTELSRLLDELAPDLPERALVSFRAFTGRNERDKSLEAMGLRTVGAGESFRYASG
jgi:hypothetical protein